MTSGAVDSILSAVRKSGPALPAAVEPFSSTSFFRTSPSAAAEPAVSNRTTSVKPGKVDKRCKIRARVIRNSVNRSRVAVERLQALQDWATRQLGGESLDIAPASAAEDCRPVIAVARLFADAGVNVPQVLAQDLDRGFLLLTDLGNTTYLSALDEAASKQDVARELYLASHDALNRIQQASRPGVLPVYDRALLTRELMLFPEWYVAKHLGVAMKDEQKAILETVFGRLLANNLAQPQVYVHRDWHSRNLMVSEPNPGILDFQDAVYGPITYV